MSENVEGKASRVSRDAGLAIVSGVLLGVAFLDARLGFLAWVGFVPLLEAIERRSAAGGRGRRLFALGYLFGLAHYLIGIHWIALLSDVASHYPWLKYPAWLAAGAYLALFSGLAVWACATLARRAALPLAVVFPFVYLAVEELRASGELGFPWFQPGYSQQAFEPLLQMASLGSVSLVTLWILFLNVLVWRAIRGRMRLRAALGALFMLLLPYVWGLRVLDAAPHEPGPRVSLVQGNIPGEIKWSGDHQTEILGRFLELSRSAVLRDSTTLLVWPETATGSYLTKRLDQRLAVQDLAARMGVPIFSGFADYSLAADGEPRYVNGAGMFRSDGSLSEVYGKRHLVPFGERIPFQWLIPALGTIDLGQAEWTPGSTSVLFESTAGPFAPLVCFEAIFPDLARGDVRAGARWLVNVTNDEWFGNSAALYQHAGMAVFRAVENHVPLARCANTGLTLLVDGNGRITARVPVFTDTVLTAALARPGLPTPYTRLGDWPGMLAALMGLVFVFVSARRSLTVRGGSA